MFAVLLLTTLLAAADPQAAQVPVAQPEDLAEAGNYKEALVGFRQRVAANPQGDFHFEMGSRCRSGSDIP